MKQQTLFPDEPGLIFTNRSVKSVTFQGKLGLPIHRWYRLTPSFSPHLALDIADYFQLDDSDMVLDPFSGVGTVPLCMKYRNIPACSVEINPFLQFVGQVKTRNYDDVDTISEVFEGFVKRCCLEVERLPPDPRDYLQEHAADIPRIQNPQRWWSPANLMQLVCVRKLVQQLEGEQHHLGLLKMGLLAILVPVSNAKHNHVSLTFAAKPLPRVDVAAILAKKYREIIDDLRAVGGKPRSEVNVYLGNSKKLADILPEKRKASAVITSPPYPNRFSYARETRPHLFFFDFIQDAKAVGDLETTAIGGTWGKATSVLAQGVTPKNDFIRSLLEPYMNGIDSNGGLMLNYVIKYFNDMYDHAAEIAKVCAKKCHLAYVIGNSKFYDHPLPSDNILAAIFQHFGFHLDRIDRMRKRQSKTGLYEAVVFMSR